MWLRGFVLLSLVAVGTTLFAYAFYGPAKTGSSDAAAVLRAADAVKDASNRRNLGNG
jgi:hypothetical protein